MFWKLINIQHFPFVDSKNKKIIKEILKYLFLRSLNKILDTIDVLKA